MVHEREGKVGYRCTCGERFFTQEKLDEHAMLATVAESKTDNKEESEVEDTTRAEVIEAAEQAIEKTPPKPEPKANKEITKVSANTKLTTDVAQKMVLKYATELVNDKRAQQFYAQTMLMARNNPELASVDPQSLLSAMMACVHLDLMPNTPEQYAYVIPYGDQAQFQIGYKGLVELAYRTGTVASINAELVFDEDVFRVELGTERRLLHHPNFEIDRTDYAKVKKVYATATLRDGTTVFEVLSRKEIEKVQKTAKAKSGDSPWNTWWGAMAKKTAVKQLTKLLPGSTEDNRLKYAAEIDSLAEVGKLKFVDGEIVSEQNNTVPEHTREAIALATSKEQVGEIVDNLPLSDRKNVAAIATARIKEL